MSENLERLEYTKTEIKANWAKEQVENVFKNTEADLKNLKEGIVTGISENHIKNILSSFKDKMEKKWFNNALKDNTWAWYTLALQIALSQLGYNPWQIDWIYRSSNQIKTKTESKTMAAVKTFQEQWNKDNPNDRLVVDWRAGPATIAKILGKLWTKTIVNQSTVKTNVKKTDETKKPEETQEEKKPVEIKKPVVVNTPKEEPEEELEVIESKLNWNELAEENYEELKKNLWGMETDISIEDTEKVYGEMTLENIREKTRTKIFCFDWSNIVKQTMVEQMLAPVIIATWDMPYNSVKNIIDSRETNYSWSVSYSIKDIAETLNVILKEENPDDKYIDTAFFKQFCKYLLDKKVIEFKDWKYLDNISDEKDFINVLFTESDWNWPKIKVWETEVRVATDIQHELHHAYFETVIAKDSNKLNELRNYFYDSNNLDTVKKFLKAIYSSEDLPYNWHFDSDGSASQKRLDFINNLTSGENLKSNIKNENYSTGNSPEFNLLTEFWAYSHEQNPTIDLGDHKFSWEEWYVAPENIESQEILNTINTRYEIAGNNNDTIDLNDVEHLTNWDILIKWKIWEEQLDIIFNSDYSNPRLQINQKQYNLYEFDRGWKKQIFVVPNSVTTYENFLSYRDNLVIQWRDEAIKEGKFDFSDSEKVTIVFKYEANEIKISFNNDWSLVTDQNNITIWSDRYTASVENWDQTAKILLAKNENNIIIQENNPEIDDILDEKAQIENIIKEKLRIDNFSITEKNNWIFEIRLIARITEEMFKRQLSDYIIIDSNWFPRNPTIEIRKPFPWENEFLQKYNFYPKNMINWIEKNDSWYKIKSDWFDIWFDLEKNNPQIIIWEKEYPLYVNKMTSNWMTIENQVAIKKSLINNLEKIFNSTKDLSISNNTIHWLEFDLSNEQWIIIRQKNSSNFKLDFDNQWNLVSNFQQIWWEKFNVYTENNSIKLEKIENDTVSLEKVSNLLEKTNLIKIDGNWDFICDDIYQIEDIETAYVSFLNELGDDSTRQEWINITTKISELSDENNIRSDFSRMKDKMDKWIKIYETYKKINDKKTEINKLDWFNVGPNWSAKVNELTKIEKPFIGKEKITNYISKEDSEKIKISQKLIELENDKNLKGVLNSGN